MERKELILIDMNMLAEKSKDNELMSDVEDNPVPADIMLIKQLEALIDKEFIAHKDSEFYRSKIHPSRKYIDRILKFHCGKTVAELVRHRTNKEAIYLLTESCMSIKSVAYHLGYCDPGHFVRSFKKHTGLTPKSFRYIKCPEKYKRQELS